MDWYYAQDGRHVGPVADAEFARLVNNGMVTAATLVWHAGMKDWVSYGNLLGMAAQPAPPPAPSPSGSWEARRFCSSCGNSFPTGDLAFFGDSGVCAACKPAWVQRFRQGMTSTTPMHLHYAGFWIRFAALLIDGIILMIAQLAILIPLGFGTVFRSSNSDAISSLFGIAQLFGFLLGISYTLFFWIKYGATPGKMLLKLKIVTPEGGQISAGQAIGRYFAQILSFLTIYIGFMMAGWDDEKRALHDRIAGTRVIYTE
jgi:uncharacterized RDD family membrane protein YckC